MRIPNNSNDITRWWKENKCESNTITVWACNGKTTLAKPEKGELICNNPNALKMAQGGCMADQSGNTYQTTS